MKAKGDSNRVAVATTKFLVGTCDCMVDSSVPGGYSYIFRVGVLRLLFWVKNLSESYFFGSANYTITFLGL